MLTQLITFVFGRVINAMAADAEQDVQIHNAMNSANRKATLAKEAARLRESGFEEQAVELEELATSLTVETAPVVIEYRETAPLALEARPSAKKKRRK